MSIWNDLARLVREKRNNHRRSRAFMRIADLPAGLRKDIGWPDGENGAVRMARMHGNATETPQ